MNDRIDINGRLIPGEYASVVPSSSGSPKIDDPLVDVGIEESVLSSMCDGKPVRSLEEHHFTSPMRKAMYRLLRGGVPMESLTEELRRDGFSEEELYYPTDVWLCPALNRGPLVEAVAELKRLHLMRRFCSAVDDWRKAAPHIEWRVALVRLGEIIRQQGLEATKELQRAGSPPQKSNGASGPSPR